MRRQIVPLLVLFAALNASARDINPAWTQIQTPHFVVLTDAGQKQGQRVADQFERMRSVFHNVFPKAAVDKGSPIVVIALKDKKGFQTLEPTAYLAKGQIDLAGLFLPAPDKNYVLLRLDAQGDHPYATVYHEYTHLLLRKDDDWLPLWLNEGMAQFFENTEIRDKDVLLGQPSAYNLQLLRDNRLLPLPTLFAVDHDSPYYHEEQKGSIFYAESWALVHYLQITDHQANRHRLGDYAERLARHEDPNLAAEHAFGDLKLLQKQLQNYVTQAMFQEFHIPTSTDVDDSAFQIKSVTVAQANAVRADFLAYNGRQSDARPLLDSVLQTEPDNVLAHETMGFLAFQANQLNEAQKWYEQAVKLDSQSYLANYYFAAIAMREGNLDLAHSQLIEASLQTCMKLNPSFADAYDRLAVLYAQLRERLDEAHKLELQATQLDPANLTYRLNTASVLMAMQRESDAVAVLKNALPLAKKPGDKSLVERQIQQIQEFQQERKQAEQARAETASGAQSTSAEMGPVNVIASSTGADSAPVSKYPVDARGPRHTLRGVIHGVTCSSPALMELKVVGAGKTISLYSNNYYKIDFSAANFTPSGDLNPCSSIEGMTALVVYAETTDKSVSGQVRSIELFK